MGAVQDIAKLLGPAEVPSASADHMRALPACQLDCVVAHATRCAMDQDLLPSLQIGRAEQSKPGRACVGWDGGRLVKADVVRL